MAAVVVTAVVTAVEDDLIKLVLFLEYVLLSKF